jgi:hypothetical protein
MLEHGAGPGCYVPEHIAEPLPSAEPVASIQGGQHSGGRRTSLLAQVGEHLDGAELGRQRGCYVEGCFLDLHPGRAGVPGHLGLEVNESMQAVAVDPLQAAVLVHRQMDRGRVVVRAPGGSDGCADRHVASPVWLMNTPGRMRTHSRRRSFRSMSDGLPPERSTWRRAITPDWWLSNSASRLSWLWSMP